MKIKIKKFFPLTLFTFICANANEAIHLHDNRPINVPKIVDGTPFGINGPQIKTLIFIIKENEKLLYGVPDLATKVRKGKYIFLNQLHTVASLAEFELQNLSMSPLEKQELKTLLNLVIDDFIKIATPFIEQGRGVKTVTLGFMREWAEKHECENSSLLTWAREKDGHEFDTLREDMHNFEDFYRFCKDLISFLSDLIQSCPRGWQQFMEMQQKNKK